MVALEEVAMADNGELDYGVDNLWLVPLQLLLQFLLRARFGSASGEDDSVRVLTTNAVWQGIPPD